MINCGSHECLNKDCDRCFEIASENHWNNLKTKNMNNNELQEKVIEWASGKMLLSRDNALKQFAKFISEAGELGDAMIKHNIEDTIDALGDVQVTLIILADQLDLNYDECLESAYNVIAKRTGKTINGTFIKD